MIMRDPSILLRNACVAPGCWVSRAGALLRHGRGTDLLVGGIAGSFADLRWTIVRRTGRRGSRRPDHRRKRDAPARAGRQDVGMTVLLVGQDDAELEKLLSDELDAINRAAIASDDETPFSIRATTEDGALLGGVTGWTWGGCGGIASLWLEPEQRGRGLGGRLLAAAENEIRRRGCDRVVVATMSFQAPGFYLRYGYEEVGRTPDMPDGTAKHHFLKRLVAVPVEPPAEAVTELSPPGASVERDGR